MNPVPVILGAMALLRLVAWAWGRVTGNEASGRGRRPPDAIYGAWLATFAFASLVAVLITGGLGLVLVIPLWALLFEPWWWIRALAVPRGWARVAYAGARLSGWVWRHDRRGGAAFGSALASVQGATPADPWIEAPPGIVSVTAGMVSGAALVAGARGDARGAAALLRFSTWFDARPGPERDVVAEWLAAEAASRGDWEEVARTSRERPTATVGSAFLHAVATRILESEDAPDLYELDRRWRAMQDGPLAGRSLDDPVRIGAAALAERARHALHRVHRADPEPSDPLEAALRAHARAMSGSGAVEGAVERWEVVLDRLPAALRDQVVAELASRAAARTPLPRLAGSLGFEVRDRLVQRGLEDLALQVRALQQRVKAHADLDPMSEVREAASLAERVRSLVGPLDAERDPADAILVRSIFRTLYSPVTDWAADLYNRRRQPFLFRALTWWLLDLARAAEDAEATDLYVRNLGVSRAWSEGAHREA